jgi:CYTH domain-containing protein
MRSDNQEIERKYKLVGLKSVHEVSLHAQNELIKHLEAALTYAAMREIVVLADTFHRQAGTDFYWKTADGREVRVRYDTVQSPVLTIKKAVPGSTDVRQEFNLGVLEDQREDQFLLALGLTVAFAVEKTSFVWKLWPREARNQHSAYGGDMEMAIYDATLAKPNKFGTSEVEGTEEVFLELEVGDDFTAQTAASIFDRFEASVNEDHEGVGFKVERITESVSKRYGRKAQELKEKETADANQ